LSKLFFFFFPPQRVRNLYAIGSALVFLFTCWFFLYRSPTPDYNELLSVLIGAQVTVVTVMFSAVLVALQLGSAQFSPRITRSFFRYNPVSQSAFYAFLFGIMLCLSVKFTYDKVAGTFAYQPLAVGAVVFVFFLMSVVLPRFVFHIADSINVASIVEQITARTLREIRIIHGTGRWETGQPLTHEPPAMPRPGLPVLAPKTGFLDYIKHDTLNVVAAEYPDWTFFVRPVVGNFVAEGDTLVEVLPPPGNVDLLLPRKMEIALGIAFRVSTFRSYEQDVLFGVRQLVDIAIKAISPAVNDPTTAVNCLYAIGLILRRMACASVPSLKVKNAGPNLHLKEFSFDTLCDLALDQIFQWGHKDPVVLAQLIETMHGVALVADNPNCLAVLRRQLRDFEMEKLQFDTAEQRDRVGKKIKALEGVLAQRSGG
jgi:uncharacterized membrane protein